MAGRLMNWTNESTINFDLMIRYISFLKKQKSINFVNQKGFDLNIYENSFIEDLTDINCINCQLNFYNQGKLVKSCDDIIQSNITSIQSFFQLSQFNSMLSFSLVFCEFKRPLCPLVFNSLTIEELIISK